MQAALNIPVSRDEKQTHTYDFKDCLFMLKPNCGCGNGTASVEIKATTRICKKLLKYLNIEYTLVLQKKFHRKVQVNNRFKYILLK